MRLYASEKCAMAYLYDLIMSGHSKKYFCHLSVKIYFVVVLLFLSGSCFAFQNINIPMDLSAWGYSGTKVKCTLTHLDTSYGKFYFRSLPDNQLSFEFRLNKKSKYWTYATLSKVSPPWVEPAFVVPVTTAQKGSSGQFSFRRNMKALLQDIAQGQWIQVMLSGKESSASETITIPLVRIHRELKKFQSCRNRLPAMSYRQARTVVLHYTNGQRQLSASQLRQLKDMVTYIDVDSRIQHILIDGHTDNTGPSITNLNLSRARAEDVAGVLKKYGVKSDLIQIRAHGSRYPVSSNHTAEGRAKNRRVTIRLVRDNEEIVSRKTTQTKKVQ
jgi:outer membrane protein OmpA-like peptidoglycan-associated protein